MHYSKSDDEFYGSYKWKCTRNRAIKRSGGFCLYCKRYGRRTEATTVHHIYPRHMYPEYQWQAWNLFPVCAACHNRLEDRVNGELTEEGKALMIHTIPPTSGLVE